MVKKTSAKKTTSRKRISEKKVTSLNPSVTQPVIMPTVPQQKRTSLLIGLVVLVAAVALFFYVFKGWFIVATVNGQPISRFALDRELEKQGGAQVLQALEVKLLIQQEADKRHISVANKEVDVAEKKYSDAYTKQGQSFDSALAMQGLTRESFREQLKYQLLAEKMVSKDVAVTDKEVDDYIAANQDTLSPSGAEVDRNAIKQGLAQKKLQAKFQALVTDLQKKAKVDTFVNF